MFYTVYKITNLINDKIYVGVHITDNLNDSYMGSGVNIKRAISKYGIKNSKKEYLSIFDNENEMFQMESEIVNKDFIKSLESYNISLGGVGSWNHINDNLSEKEKYDKGKWLGDNYGSIAGSWDDINKRQKILSSIPIEKRRDIGKKMGDVYGGHNKLSENNIKDRLSKIKDIDLMSYGWVGKVSKRLGITHTQVKRFIKNIIMVNIILEKKE